MKNDVSGPSKYDFFDLFSWGFHKVPNSSHLRRKNIFISGGGSEVGFPTLPLILIHIDPRKIDMAKTPRGWLARTKFRLGNRSSCDADFDPGHINSGRLRWAGGQKLPCQKVRKEK